MSNFDEEIKKITEEMIKGSEFENIIREQFRKGFETAVGNAFSHWGPVKKAIEKRIEEIMVPYIENYDMSAYIVKLDSLLTDIVTHTALQDNKVLLENFRSLMTEPDVKTVTLNDIMDKYKKHVAAHMSTTGREIDYDDEPTYVPMEIYAAIEMDDDRPWSSYQHAMLELGTEEEDQQDELNFSIRLTRWKKDKEKGYDICYDVPPSVRGMKFISEFEVYLLRLTRAGVRLLDDEDRLYDDVTSDNTPEATFE